DFRAIKAKTPGALRAFVAIANPTDLLRFKLAAFDTSAEYARIQAALAPIPITPLIDNRSVTLNNLLTQLHDDYDILYLVAHGARREGTPRLWLEKDDGTSDV